MSDSLANDSLARELLEIARDAGLRQSVYLQLGEYCHQCRNRLNSLKLSLFLAIRQSDREHAGDWEPVERRYLELERIVDRVQTICRPMNLSRVTIDLELLFEDRREEWSRWMAAGGGDLKWAYPRARSPASFDVEWMGQALDALVRWRAGGLTEDRQAVFRWWVESSRACISWEESPEVGTNSHEGGATWALPLIARVLEAHGGEYRVSLSFGWRIDLSWPLSAESP